MIGFVVGIGLLLYVAVPYLRSLKGTPGGRALLVVGAAGVVLVAFRRVGELPPAAWAVVLVAYFAFGGVAYAWERWCDTAGDRLARAKSVAQAAQRMRRPLPPAAPSPAGRPPGAGNPSGGTP